MTTIKCNDFVKRQTAASPFSHFDGTWEELEGLTREYFSNHKPGYRDGVVLVSVPADRFFSGVVSLDNNLCCELTATYSSRREGEAPFIMVTAKGRKLPAKTVDIVLYSRETLGSAGADGVDWEVISVNARPTTEPEPMHPVAMARNFLAREGGTAATYTAEEFAKAIEYWSCHAMVTP